METTTKATAHMTREGVDLRNFGRKTAKSRCFTRNLFIRKPTNKPLDKFRHTFGLEIFHVRSFPPSRGGEEAAFGGN